MSKSSSSSGSRKALAEQRKRLKIRLWKERSEDLGWLSIAVPRPRCPWDGLPLPQPDCCVMHEVFIKRSDLPVEKQHLIMHEYNCVLAHYNCHEQHGQTREFKLRCARAQYKRYGRDEIVAWVQGLELRQHVEVPTEEEADGNGRKEIAGILERRE